VFEFAVKEWGPQPLRLLLSVTDCNAISLGVATLRKDDTVQSLIARADACLYAAKRNGRNRVICETDPEFAATAESKVA